MKKILSLSVVLFASLLTFAEVTGTGTEDDPFIVAESCTVTDVPANGIAVTVEYVYFKVTSPASGTVTIEGTQYGWNFCAVDGKTVTTEDNVKATFEATANTTHTVLLNTNYDSTIKFTLPDPSTGISRLSTSSSQNGKFIENGRLVIKKNGKHFNAAGQLMK